MKETVSQTAFVITNDDKIEAVVLNSNTLASKIMRQLKDTDEAETTPLARDWKLTPISVLTEEDLI